MISIKWRGLFGKLHWLTGKIGIDLGRNGSRPLDLNPRAGAKGGDNRRRRGPADGGAWPGAHRSRRSRRPGLDLARYLDGEYEYATANSIRASARGIGARTELTAASGGAATPASKTMGRKARARGRTGWRASKPRREATGRRTHRREAVERRRGGGLRELHKAARLGFLAGRERRLRLGAGQGRRRRYL